MTKTEALAAKNGPFKKFYLLKHYGADLRAAGHGFEDLRKLGCDEIVALLKAKSLI